VSTDRLTDEFIEEERYELREGPAYRFAANRREFVQVLGAGLVIVVSSRGVSAQQGRGRGRGGRGDPPAKISQRFHVGEDGIVTVMSGKVEVGQGSRTQVAQAVAEELRIPMRQVRVVLGDTELCPNDGGTSGSRTTPSTIPRIRTAAAATRELLIDLAAEKLNTGRSALSLDDGKIVDSDSKKELTLADLARDEDFAAEFDRTPPENISVVHVDRWKVLGSSVPKIDSQDVVTGTLRYPSDIAPPGTLYGKVLRPPSFGATLRSIDLRPAESIEDVTVVRDGSFVGCAATSSWLAEQAIQLLASTARWELQSDHVSSDKLFAHFKQHASSQGSGWPQPRTSAWGNDVEKALGTAGKTIEASYEVAYIQHVPMEPRAAVADWTDGKLTVWTGTQNPLRVRSELASAFRTSEDAVRVIVPDTGGAFGGKHTGEAAVEAARLAKAASRPVSLRWTREEEFTWAYCRPAGLIEVRAGLDGSGAITAWDFTNYNSGGSAIATPYQIPHGRTRFLASDSPLRQGSYRALASAANTFARESAMDELAMAASTDPLQFRLQHLPTGRVRDVLEAVAKRFEWADRVGRRAARRGVGLACGTEKDSYVAACAEVEIEQGKIKVRRVCQAYECGAVQNPANLRAQVEGCIIMGLGGALTEEVQFADGVVTNASLSSYIVPRMEDVPEIDTLLVDRRDLESVGAGETPIIAVAPAIANAVAHATGVRIRSMPLKSELLSRV
jgi:isoquinoline 1-oxidoreductase